MKPAALILGAVRLHRRLARDLLRIRKRFD